MQNSAVISEVKCGYCNKVFRKESSLLTHRCETKRRHEEKSERGVQIGFYAYTRFYQLMHISGQQKSHNDFIDSPYYKAFVKFGRHAIGIRAINPEAMVDWLLKNNKKLDYWCKEQFYTDFLEEYLKVEPVADALTRAIEYSITWAEEKNMPAHDVLRYGNANALVFAVTTGRISPWVIYNSESGQKFLSTLDVSHISMVWPYIDSDAWQKKFTDHSADQEYAKKILKQAGW